MSFPLFGYTSTDVLIIIKKKMMNHLFWILRLLKIIMEITQETKVKSIVYPKNSIQQLPTKFNEATINDIAKQYDPI